MYFIIEWHLNGSALYEQTDSSLAIEAKCMRRWEFDSTQAAKCITSWFPGTLRERFLLETKLNSMLGINLHRFIIIQ